jgi:competence protein ComEC
MHLLAVSGLHLSILTGILLSAFIFLLGKRYYIYIWLTMGMIWLYALLTGMQSPIIRATIMASLFLIADLLGRQRSAITALIFAAAVMVALEPQVIWTASFQMSFAAMAGLILLVPILRKIGENFTRSFRNKDGLATGASRFINEGFSVSAGAIIGVAPLVAYYFGIVSLAAPAVTLITLPALPGAIISSGLTGGLGFISLTAARFIGWVAWFFISYILIAVQAFGTLKLVAIDVSVKPIIVWIYYLVLALIIYFVGKRWGVKNNTEYAAIESYKHE